MDYKLTTETVPYLINIILQQFEKLHLIAESIVSNTDEDKQKDLFEYYYRQNFNLQKKTGLLVDYIDSLKSKDALDLFDWYLNERSNEVRKYIGSSRKFNKLFEELKEEKETMRRWELPRIYDFVTLYIQSTGIKTISQSQYLMSLDKLYQEDILPQEIKWGYFLWNNLDKNAQEFDLNLFINNYNEYKEKHKLNTYEEYRDYISGE